MSTMVFATMATQVPAFEAFREILSQGTDVKIKPIRPSPVVGGGGGDVTATATAAGPPTAAAAAAAAAPSLVDLGVSYSFETKRNKFESVTHLTHVPPTKALLEVIGANQQIGSQAFFAPRSGRPQSLGDFRDVQTRQIDLALETLRAWPREVHVQLCLSSIDDR